MCIRDRCDGAAPDHRLCRRAPAIAVLSPDAGHGAVALPGTAVGVAAADSRHVDRISGPQPAHDKQLRRVGEKSVSAIGLTFILGTQRSGTTWLATVSY